MQLIGKYDNNVKFQLKLIQQFIAKYYIQVLQVCIYILEWPVWHWALLVVDIILILLGM